MVFDPAIKYYSQVKKLYDRFDEASSDWSSSVRADFSMRMMCELIVIMKVKHQISDQNLAELLNLPLFVVQEIDELTFPMTKKTFYFLMKSFGEARESLTFGRQIERKLCC